MPEIILARDARGILHEQTIRIDGPEPKQEPEEVASTEPAPEEPQQPESLEDEEFEVLGEASETFPCPHCEFVASGRAGLASHIRAKHEDS